LLHAALESKGFFLLISIPGAVEAAAFCVFPSWRGDGYNLPQKCPCFYITQLFLSPSDTSDLA